MCMHARPPNYAWRTIRNRWPHNVEGAETFLVSIYCTYFPPALWYMCSCLPHGSHGAANTLCCCRLGQRNACFLALVFLHIIPSTSKLTIPTKAREREENREKKRGQPCAGHDNENDTHSRFHYYLAFYFQISETRSCLTPIEASP